MGFLGDAEKLIKQHPKQVDEALEQAAKLAKEHVPHQGDAAIDAGVKAAEKAV